MKYRGNSAALFFFVTVLLAACDGAANFIGGWPSSASGEKPPYIITRPLFEINERPNYFHCAGMVFNFLNTAQKDIDRITVSFMLFDTVTQANPFTGGNKFEITKLDHVFPNENKKVIISLDRFFYIAPNEPYIIDAFYISGIHYTDGSNWQDKFGAYRVNW